MKNKILFTIVVFVLFIGYVLYDYNYGCKNQILGCEKWEILTND